MRKKQRDHVRHNAFIRKGDRVVVIAGNDRGACGSVLSRTANRVIVQGVNVRKKSVRRKQQNEPGGLLNIECGIHISNVKLCSKDDVPIAVRAKNDDINNRVLVYQREGQETVHRIMRKQG